MQFCTWNSLGTKLDLLFFACDQFFYVIKEMIACLVFVEIHYDYFYLYAANYLLIYFNNH